MTLEIYQSSEEDHVFLGRTKKKSSQWQNNPNLTVHCGASEPSRGDVSVKMVVVKHEASQKTSTKDVLECILVDM